MSETQSVIFDKSIFTKNQAIKWLERNNMKHKKVDETEGRWRFRQIPVGDKKKYLFRTILVTSGVQFVLQFKK